MLTNEAINYTYDYHKHIQRKQRISAFNNLILFRNHILNEQKERKLLWICASDVDSEKIPIRKADFPPLPWLLSRYLGGWPTQIS